MIGVLKKFRTYYSLFGRAGLWLAIRTRLARRPTEVAVAVPGFTHPIYLRLKGTDVPTFKKVFYDCEYEFPMGKEPRVIVDAGANVGFATIFFARKYPAAKILALEPERSNFALLQKNVQPYPNVIPIQSALWSENTTLNLVDPGIGDWGFQTQSNQAPASAPVCEQVQAVTVDSLMNRFRVDVIDILKVDIEGSEKEVFQRADAWIDRIGVLMVELHDRMKVGCSRSVYLATQNFEFESHRGENVFFARKDMLRQAVPPLQAQG